MNENESVKAKNKPLKDVELRLIAELMKNSRRSDRDLARALGISQPTVSRMRERLEKRGIIREYTMIPDLRALGYQIMASTRFEISEKPFAGREEARQMMINTYPAIIAVEGQNDKWNRLSVNFYQNYTEYSKATTFLRRVPLINADNIDTFLVDLNDKRSFRFLSLSALADRLLQRLEEKEASSHE